MTDLTPDSPARPWLDLEGLLDRDSRDEVLQFLGELGPHDLARCVDRLGPEHRARLLEFLGAEHAAAMLEHLPDIQGGALLQSTRPETAAAILEELYSDDQAGLLTTLDETDAASILAKMEPEAAQDVAALAAYPRDTAGGLMNTEYLAYPRSTTVGDLVADLRRRVDEIAERAIQYLYVIDSGGRLEGVLPLRDLLLAPDTRTLDRVMVPNPVSVSVDTALDDLIELFDKRPFLGLPVVEDGGVLRGVVLRQAAENARGDRAESDHLKARGIVGGDELRSMPLWLRARRRLSWLSVNIGLNILAASVIAAYQDTLSAVIALAVFLPIISDMSGCSGNQAVAVSMRELTLGVRTPADAFFVWRKEALLGLINGAALGLLLGAAAWAWKGNPALGLIVGVALAANTVVAVSIGGVMPLVLKRLGVDPALASGPILTTLTDMCGFFLALSLATAALASLR